MQDTLHVDHLPRAGGQGSAPAAFWLESGDVVLAVGSERFVAHRPVVALHSAHLSELLSLRNTVEEEEADHRLPLPPTVAVLPANAPAGSVPSSKHFGAFLSEMYRTHGSGLQWDSLPNVLHLADYFGAAAIVARADAWLCDQLLHGRPPPEAVCLSFELAARHRLGGAMALLLPWAVQCMARGSRCASVWFDGKQRCCRLKAAFEDSQLKCLVLNAYWWSRESPGPECPTCHCRPADVEASWDTRREWAAPAGALSRSAGAGDFQPASPSHARASQHYAHLLEEARWGVTPPRDGAALVAGPAGGGGGAGAP